MSNGLSYEAVLELLPAYAVGALEPDELLAVDEYLQQQRALLARVERLEAATAQLAYGAPLSPLASQVKRALMAQVQADAHRAGAPLPMPAVKTTAPAARNPLLGGRQLGAARPQPQPMQPALPPQLPARRFNFGWLAAAAMALAALFIIWIDLDVQRQLSAAEAALAQRDVQLTALNQQLSELEQQLQQNQLQLAFFANPSQIVPLRGTDSAPTAGGVFYQHDTRALLLLHGLPPLPAEQTYQLWLIPPTGTGEPAPAGLLAIHSAAINQQQVELPADALAYSAIGISIEPAIGSTTPTGAIVMVGEKT